MSTHSSPLRLVSYVSLSLALLISALGSTPPPEGAAAVPPGFTDTLLADNIVWPTALAFAPDGRMLVTTQNGRLRVYDLNGALLATALNFADLTRWPFNQACTNSERGLLGIAVDPNFANNNYIYVYYTFNRFQSGNPCPTGSGNNTPVNRVSRFVLPANNSIVTTTQTVLLDNIPSINGNHNGGDINFGKDGYLYIATGESGTGGGLARVKTNLGGKILRINADGTVPTSNPFYNDANAWRCGNPAGGSGIGSCREIFAYGLRHPFRFAFDPNTSGTTTRFFINDVGQGTWEEIDEGIAGADYGWNVREGPCLTDQNCNPASSLPSAYTDPIHWYGRSVGTVVTGGAFVPNGLGWPPEYTSAYLFADYGAGRIFRINRTSTTGIDQWARTDFATNLGGSSAVHLRFGPYQSTQALYYTTYASGGEVRRIAVNNSAPTAVIAANPTYGASVPLTVNFSGAGSNDPNNDPLTYAWTFGDTLTATTMISTTSHDYQTANVYTATLIVRDDKGFASSPVQIQIQAGNTPPTPTITLPTGGATFAVGDVINLSGNAADAEPAPEPVTLKWDVLLHHSDSNNPGGAHTHPWYSTTGATGQFTAPAPEDLNATALSYLEVQLTATDAWGLSAVVTETLQPRRVDLTFATQPNGLQITVNNSSLTGSQTVTAWEGWGLTASAPVVQFQGVNAWAFDHWENASPSAARSITTPATNTTYTATFIPAQRVFLPVIRK